MILASELAGFFAAHAVWSLSESDSFSPLFAYTTEDGEKKMERLVGDLPAAVEHGRQRLEGNEVDAIDAVLLYDARIPADNEKLDAVVIEMRSHCFPWAKATIAIPYSPKSTGK